MSTSVVATRGLIFFGANAPSLSPLRPVKFSAKPLCARARFDVLIPNSKGKGRHRRRTSWWKRFFLEDDGNWLGLKDDDMLEDEVEVEHSSGKKLQDGDKFEAWKRRAEAIVELREAQQDSRNEESRMWEDWLVEDGAASWDDGNGGAGNSGEGLVLDSGERGIVESVSDMILGREDEDTLYEDRVFRYASQNSAKFLVILITIPWALDFIVHDYVLMPFLDRYVKTVPLAAQMLDVRRHQKLEMVKELKVEKARYRFEEEIGKSPPLSDEEVWLELRHKALELRDEWRLENRRTFANIWSDMVFGISLFLILYFNQSKVALLKFTGYKIINNISDTGKAFLIILITDIFLGYHSESGWQTLIEVIVEHYGLEVDQSAITIFICLIPVVTDACVKLWLFKFLPRLSPKVSNIFQEMKRH
ncbi:chloroplast envelope membrane protein [Rhodamnia argentea]|uniref:Chloroplast envelope membrane protein n=1 Tax=Rhodamnia argentea TaxID=178133 RepID=A0A8B8Q7X4_9MYRT|nr:chloroplast envelope membrane protein [Rhodamnia argentea]